jgi:hypothetical protein
LKMVGNKLSAKEEEAYHNKGTQKPRSPRRHNSPRHRSGSQQSRTPSPRWHKSQKHGGTQRSRTLTKAYDYEDDEKEMGASCFTHRVRTTPVPKGSPRSAKIRWISGAIVMALGLSTSSKNNRRNQGNSNAKFAITPHRRSKVMVE